MQMSFRALFMSMYIYTFFLVKMNAGCGDLWDKFDLLAIQTGKEKRMKRKTGHFSFYDTMHGMIRYHQDGPQHDKRKKMVTSPPDFPLLHKQKL